MKERERVRSSTAVTINCFYNVCSVIIRQEAWTSHRLDLDGTRTLSMVKDILETFFPIAEGTCALIPIFTVDSPLRLLKQVF